MLTQTITQSMKYLWNFKLYKTSSRKSECTELWVVEINFHKIVHDIMTINWYEATLNTFNQKFEFSSQTFVNKLQNEFVNYAATHNRPKIPCFIWSYKFKIQNKVCMINPS